MTVAMEVRMVVQSVLKEISMIYYSIQRVLLLRGHESQGINDAIQRGLTALAAESGVPMILTNVIPVVMHGWFRTKICLTITAKPYESEKQQDGLEDLLGQAMKIEGGRGIIEKLGETLLRGAGKIGEEK